jgi:hypothetical protein
LEYLAGSFVTLTIIFVLNRLLSKKLNETKVFKPRVSQSYLYQFLASYVESGISKEQKSQSSEFLNKKYVKVVVLENEAYWIHDNQLFVADYHDGEVDRLSAKQVDTFSMSSKELEKTRYVVDKLTEGNNENSGSGDKSF